MTLDKAIEVYEFWANAHERDAEYHRPLGYSHETIANVAEMHCGDQSRNSVDGAVWHCHGMVSNRIEMSGEGIDW